MEETTRPATSDEIGTVVALLREGRAEIDGARGALLWLQRAAVAEPLEAWIAAAIETPSRLVQLGYLDDVPLGVTLVVADKAGDSLIAVVRELYVTPDARGVGLGEAMMNAVMQWAAQQRCAGVDGYAFPGDRATKNFFESFGLVARGIVVHRNIQ